jgi:hypothetical protein
VRSQFSKAERTDDIHQFAGANDEAAADGNERNLSANMLLATSDLPSLLSSENPLDIGTSNNETVHPTSPFYNVNLTPNTADRPDNERFENFFADVGGSHCRMRLCT